MITQENLDTFSKIKVVFNNIILYNKGYLYVRQLMLFYVRFIYANMK
jgi:hypothetical protein